MSLPLEVLVDCPTEVCRVALGVEKPGEKEVAAVEEPAEEKEVESVAKHNEREVRNLGAQRESADSD